eukprot:m.332220 g.332220  ORF g.332220 m.332220 type:complete len:94 (-) comp16900_c0_seq1:105-386(-)
MVKADSNTNVGKGGGAGAMAPSRGGGGVRQRGRGGTGSVAKKAAPAGSSTGQWRFYQEDSPGLKVGPVPVLVLSLLFIASVFMLHIWGKFSRG